jgi:hypothetical protein
METRDDKPRLCRVVLAYHTPYPDPLIVRKGQDLVLGGEESEWPGWVWCSDGDGKSGWVPEKYVQLKDETCTMLRDYDATELSVGVGEDLIAGNEESGWIWCANRAGQSGWVPLQNVELLP